jgi:hypothetical protein
MINIIPVSSLIKINGQPDHTADNELPGQRISNHSSQEQHQQGPFQICTQ